MAVKIRLARFGAKKRSFYRIVVADSRAPRDGRFIEKIGQYDPMLPKDNKNRVVVKADRLKHWLSVGVQATERVLWFINKGIVTLETTKENRKEESRERESTGTRSISLFKMLNTDLTYNGKLDDFVSSDLSAMKDFIFKNVNDEGAKLATDIISHLVSSGGKK